VLQCLKAGGLLVLALPIQTDFTYPVQDDYHGDNALMYRRNGWDLIEKLKTYGYHVDILTPPAHFAFQRPPHTRDDAYVLDNIRCRQTFGTNFESNRSSFYALCDQITAQHQRFDDCWGYLEVFWARRPFVLTS
jgi:hypothetical protein